MLKLILVWLINALALLAVAYVMPGIAIETFWTAMAAAVVLGLVLLPGRRIDVDIRTG